MTAATATRAVISRQPGSAHFSTVSTRAQSFAKNSFSEFPGVRGVGLAPNVRHATSLASANARQPVIVPQQQDPRLVAENLFDNAVKELASPSAIRLNLSADSSSGGSADDAAGAAGSAGAPADGNSAGNGGNDDRGGRGGRGRRKGVIKISESDSKEDSNAVKAGEESSEGPDEPAAASSGESQAADDIKEMASASANASDSSSSSTTVLVPGTDGGSSNVPDKIPIPKDYPQLLAIPLTRRPLFPGFYKTVYIKDPQVIAAVHDLVARRQAYVGVFMTKDDNYEPDVITDLDQIHPVGVFAQIANVYASGPDNSGLTVLLYPHRRIRAKSLIPLPRTGAAIKADAAANADKDTGGEAAMPGEF